MVMQSGKKSTENIIFIKPPHTIYVRKRTDKKNKRKKEKLIT